MKNGRKRLVKILTILTLLFGTVSLLQTSFKIIRTSAELFVLHDNIEFYNEMHIKTDKMTEEYLENLERRNEIYHSDDNVERIFSNQHFIIKLFLTIWSQLSIILIPYMWVSLAFMEIRRIVRKIEREKME